MIFYHFYKFIPIIIRTLPFHKEKNKKVLLHRVKLFRKLLYLKKKLICQISYHFFFLFLFLENDIFKNKH